MKYSEVVAYRESYRQIYSIFYDNIPRCNESWFIFLKRLVLSNSDFCILVGSVLCWVVALFCPFSVRHMHSRIFFFSPFPPRDYPFGFPGRKFFQTVLSMLRFYLNVRPLCTANLFLFYRRTYAPVRVLASPGVRPALTFSKTGGEFCLMRKARRRGSRSEPLTKGRTEWKSRTSTLL